MVLLTISELISWPAGWIHNSLGGIRVDPTKPGFENVIIRPAMVGNLEWVNSHHESAFGRIVSNWKLDGDQVTVEVTIPANSTGTVHVPTANASYVRVDGKCPTEIEHVTFLRMERGAAVLAIDSGTYTFTATLN